jgi:hypothetical protein
MPFVHWDTVEYLKEREIAVDILSSDKLPPALRSAYAKAGTNLTTRLNSASIMGDSPLHLSQLLDQYKHSMVSMPADRIRKQILPKLTENSGAGSRSLTVQQLWLIAPGNGIPSSTLGCLTFMRSSAYVDRHCAHLFPAERGQQRCQQREPSRRCGDCHT